MNLDNRMDSMDDVLFENQLLKKRIEELEKENEMLKQKIKNAQVCIDNALNACNSIIGVGDVL